MVTIAVVKASDAKRTFQPKAQKKKFTSKKFLKFFEKISHTFPKKFFLSLETELFHPKHNK